MFKDQKLTFTGVGIWYLKGSDFLALMVWQLINLRDEESV